jgi:flagellar motor switch protein FliN/FliY
MAEEDMDGLLSQEDIDAALEAAGLSNGNADASKDSADSSSNQQESGQMSQDEINAALEQAQTEQNQSAEDQSVSNADPQNDQQQSGEDTRVDASGRAFDDVAAAMADAIQQESGGQQVASNQQADNMASNAAPLQVPELDAGIGNAGANLQGIELLRDVELGVKIELGRSKMLVDDVLRLGEGSVVELDKLAGDPVDVYVNGRLVARGEVLVLNDNFCVRINDIVTNQEEEEEDSD